MTITIAPTAPHTDAVMAALAPVILAGRSSKPDGGGWQGEPGRSNYVAYAVVYPSLGVADGNEAEPLEYLDYSAQINLWGITVDQVEAVADRVRVALIGRRLAVAGRSTYRVQSPGGPPVRRDEAAQPPLYQAVVEIEFRSQPA